MKYWPTAPQLFYSQSVRACVRSYERRLDPEEQVEPRPYNNNKIASDQLHVCLLRMFANIQVLSCAVQCHAVQCECVCVSSIVICLCTVRPPMYSDEFYLQKGREGHGGKWSPWRRAARCFTHLRKQNERASDRTHHPSKSSINEEWGTAESHGMERNGVGGRWWWW